MLLPLLHRMTPRSAWLALGVGFGTFCHVPFASAEKLPDNVIPNNCGVQLKKDTDSAADLDRVKAAGFKFVRRGFIWSAVEKQKGTYDFSLYDRFVKDCRERGLGIVGCIAFAHPEYGDKTVLSEEGRQGYAKFAAALAERYKGEHILWEIWNEPNVRTFWGKHGEHNSEPYADQYLALIKATVPAMKQANPNCFLLGGAVSGVWSASYRWTDVMFEKGVLKSGIDAWSVHPYSVKSPEDYVEAFGLIREKMVANHSRADFPILNSERGFPVGEAEGFAGGDKSMRYEYQAWHFVRQYMVEQLLDVKLTIWYEWGGTEGFALMEKGKPTPALNAATAMIAELRGYRFDKRIDVESKRDFVLRFTSADGGVKLVAWTSPPPGETPDGTQQHPVTFPIADSGTFQVVQLYGEKETVDAKDNALTITLKGAPQYITLKAGTSKQALTD